MDHNSRSPLRLTSQNLQLVAFQKSSTERTAETFVRSQRHLLSLYAAEGAKVFAEWDKEVVIGENVPIESMTLKESLFAGSPLLKSRVDRAMEENVEDDTDEQPTAETRRSPKAQRKVDLPSRIPQSDPTKRDHSTRMKDKNNSVDKENVNPRKILKTKNLGSEDERVARLSERRERRRTKREILKHFVPLSSTESCSLQSPNELVQSVSFRMKDGKRCRSPSNDDQADPAQRKHEKNSRNKALNGKEKEKPVKGKKILSGAALLLNFVAKNIGKDRITKLKPAPKVGVFNKGVASASTKVDRTKGKTKNQTKLSALIFSESAFLNKTAPLEDSGGHIRVLPFSDEDEESDLGEGSPPVNEAETRDVQIKLPKSTVSRFFSVKPAAGKSVEITETARTGGNLSVTKDSISEREDEEESSSNSEVPDKNVRVPRYSPSWDLESEIEHQLKQAEGADANIVDDVEMEDVNEQKEVTTGLDRPSANPSESLVCNFENLPRSQDSIRGSKGFNIHTRPDKDSNEASHRARANGLQLALDSACSSSPSKSPPLRPLASDISPPVITDQLTAHNATAAYHDVQPDRSNGLVSKLQYFQYESRVLPASRQCGRYERDVIELGHERILPCVSNNFGPAASEAELFYDADEEYIDEYDAHSFEFPARTAYFDILPEQEGQEGDEEDEGRLCSRIYLEPEPHFQTGFSRHDEDVEFGREFRSSGFGPDVFFDDGLEGDGADGDDEFDLGLAEQWKSEIVAMYEPQDPDEIEGEDDERLTRDHSAEHFQHQGLNMSPLSDDASPSERTFSDDDQYLRFAAAKDSMTMEPFSEGRALLLGLQAVGPPPKRTRTLYDDCNAEHEVARTLEGKGHWTKFRP